MICSTCGATNRAGRKFCAQCASPLAVACPSCGASNEPEDLEATIGDARTAGSVAPTVPAGAAAELA